MVFGVNILIHNIKKIINYEFLCNSMVNQVAIVTIAIQILCTYLQYRTRWCVKISYWCLNLMLVILSCRKASMTVTSLSIHGHGSFMYLPFLVKICSSGMQLTMNSGGKILCTSQMSTFLSPPVRSETSSCLVPINVMILKFGMCFESQFNFVSNHY